MDILQNAAGRTLDVSVNPSIFPPWVDVSFPFFYFFIRYASFIFLEVAPQLTRLAQSIRISGGMWHRLLKLASPKNYGNSWSSELATCSNVLERGFADLFHHHHQEFRFGKLICYTAMIRPGCLLSTDTKLKVHVQNFKSNKAM
jgi:hypothetical protein